MIRREIQLPGEPVQWLLISQIEHARMSGVLAEHCMPEFEVGFRQDLMHAVIHHDDGWGEWELAPQIDPHEGRPYSFRELPLVDSLKIWRDSVLAAADFGPLAGWVVAGHFLDLQGKGDSAHEPIGLKWRNEMIARRDVWFDLWTTENPKRNSRSLADLGLAWLQLLDMMSLWLCSVCPGSGETLDHDRDSYLFAEGQVLETWCHFRQQRASFAPWQFESPVLEVVGSGSIVPIDHYEDVADLLTVAVPHEISWKLESLT